MEGFRGWVQEEDHEFDFGAAAAVHGCDAIDGVLLVPGFAASSEEATSSFDLEDEVGFRLPESTRRAAAAPCMLLLLARLWLR